MPNNRINADWQFHYAPSPAGYAGRYKLGELLWHGNMINQEQPFF